MRIGLIGAGSMASALARGWGEPVLVADAVPERARALAEEVGGTALGSGAEVAEQADLVVLCHKPAQLAEVAAEAGSASARGANASCTSTGSPQPRASATAMFPAPISPICMVI